MFTIGVSGEGQILLGGRFDASQVERACTVFDHVNETRRVNFQDLEYISSAGLGVLLKTQKRLNEQGQELILINMNKLIRDVFRIARFDLLFQIEQEQPLPPRVS